MSPPRNSPTATARYPRCWREFIATNGHSHLGGLDELPDARSWTPELRAEREALNLIHFLRDLSHPQSDGLNAISADLIISEPVRQRALQFARDWKQLHCRRSSYQTRGGYAPFCDSAAAFHITSSLDLTHHRLRSRKGI